MATPTLERIEARLRQLPEDKLVVVADFISYLVDRQRETVRIDTMLASEAVLQRDWERPEEDAAYGRFVKGGVVVLPFPFSDLSATKRRPAFVVAGLPGDDVILSQITSRAITNASAVPLMASDFTEGSLHQDGNVRPDRLFTADSRGIAYRAGRLAATKVQEIIAAIIAIVSA